MADEEEAAGGDTDSAQQGTAEVKSDDTQSTKSGPKMGKDAQSVGQMLRGHWLFQGHPAYDNYPKFKATVQDIVSTLRQSAMKSEKVKEFMEQKKYVGRLNEDTVMHTLLPMIISKEYTKVLQGNELKTYLEKLQGAQADEETEMARNTSSQLNVGFKMGYCAR
jgi:hypothetical protein